MGTSASGLALIALQILREAGLEYAMLHGRESLLEGNTVSDVDLVVELEPDRIVTATKAAFASRGLFPVAVSRYDLAGTRGVWYALGDASEGVQMDLLHDAAGLGRQGLRSEGLLSLARQDLFPPVISDEAELVYLWRKRAWKGQVEKLNELRDAARSLPVARITEASIAITGSKRAAHEILGARRFPAWTQTILHPALRVKRIAQRVARPAGYWLHVPSEQLAGQVEAAFRRFLPYSRVGEVPRSQSARNRWFLSSVQPVRLRPGIFVSYGIEPEQPRPDLTTTDDSSARSVAISCVQAMAARF